MKSPYTFLTLILGMAVVFPSLVFPEDQKKEEHKSSGTQQHAGKSGPQTAPHAPSSQNHATNSQHQGGRTAPPGQHMQVSHPSNVQQAGSQRFYSGGNASHGQQRQAQGASPQIVSNGSAQSYHQTAGSTGTPQVAHYRNGRGGGYAGQITPNARYNSGNRYGGNWYPANAHSDWDQSGQYYWNHHNYCWYQGGWLIIDTGFNPYYVNTRYPEYSNTGSTVSSVQAGLAAQGYYNGPVDGIMGRGTRSAIANYQSDHQLRVTGSINDDLMQSLQPQ